MFWPTGRRSRWEVGSGEAARGGVGRRWVAAKPPAEEKAGGGFGKYGHLRTTVNIKLLLLDINF